MVLAEEALGGGTATQMAPSGNEGGWSASKIEVGGGGWMVEVAAAGCGADFEEDATAGGGRRLEGVGLGARDAQNGKRGCLNRKGARV